MNIAEMVYGKGRPQGIALGCCSAFTMHEGRECWYFTDRQGILRRKHQRNTSLERFLSSSKSSTDYVLSCHHQSLCKVMTNQEMKRFGDASELVLEVGGVNKVELIELDRGEEVFAVHYTPSHAFVPQSVSLNTHMKRHLLSSLAAIAHQLPLVTSMKMWVQRRTITHQLTLLALSDISIQSTILFQGLQLPTQLPTQLPIQNTNIQDDIPNKKKGSSLLRKYIKYQGEKNGKPIEVSPSKPTLQQLPPTKEQIHQCAACRCLVEGQGKMIAQHQVPKIQCLRSIRSIIKPKDRDTMYDMTRICDQCYSLFCDHIFQKDEKQREGKQRQEKTKSKSLSGQDRISQGKIWKSKRVSKYECAEDMRLRRVATQGRSSQFENSRPLRETNISKHSDYSTKIAVRDNWKENAFSRENTKVSSEINLDTAISEYAKSSLRRH